MGEQWWYLFLVGDKEYYRNWLVKGSLKLKLRAVALWWMSINVERGIIQKLLMFLIHMPSKV